MAIALVTATAGRRFGDNCVWCAIGGDQASLPSISCWLSNCKQRSGL